MSESIEHTARDPFGYRDELREAMAAPELDAFDQGVAPGPDVHGAAYRVARALGYCRLCGIEPGEDLDCTLTAAVAMAAAAHLAELLESAAGDARQLGPRWDDAGTQFEIDALCADVIEMEMDSWAALVAIEEAYSDCIEADEPAEAEFRPMLSLLMDRIDAFDAAARAEAELLSTLAATPLLENWRGMLSEEYSRSLPWWLDGTLERVAQVVEREARASARDWLPRLAPEQPLAGKAAKVWASEQAYPYRPDRLPLPTELALGRADPSKASGPEQAETASITAAIDWSWTSPDGRFLAQLMLLAGMRLGASHPLTVTFHRADDSPATELAGCRVRLGSGQTPAYVNDSRTGDFPPGRRADQRRATCRVRHRPK